MSATRLFLWVSQIKLYTVSTRHFTFPIVRNGQVHRKSWLRPRRVKLNISDKHDNSMHPEHFLFPILTYQIILFINCTYIRMYININKDVLFT